MTGVASAASWFTGRIPRGARAINRKDARFTWSHLRWAVVRLSGTFKGVISRAQHTVRSPAAGPAHPGARLAHVKVCLGKVRPRHHLLRLTKPSRSMRVAPFLRRSSPDPFQVVLLLPFVPATNIASFQGGLDGSRIRPCGPEGKWTHSLCRPNLSSVTPTDRRRLQPLRPCRPCGFFFFSFLCFFCVFLFFIWATPVSWSSLLSYRSFV